MSNSRLFLIVSIFALGFMLWQQWQIDYGPKVQPPAVADTQQPADVPGISAPDSPAAEDVPSLSAADIPQVEASTTPAIPAQTRSGREVSVHTDVMDIRISETGASLVGVKLLDYPLHPNTPDQVVHLFSADSQDFYQAQSGLVSNSHSNVDHQQPFLAEQLVYELEGDEVVVPFTYSAEGIEVVREYRFTRGSYEVQVTDRITNASSSNWTGLSYRQLVRVPPPELPGNTFSNPSKFSFTGAGIYTPAEHYEKLDFEEIREDGETIRRSEDGWIGMIQHYFISAWVPEQVDRFEVRPVNATTGPRRYVARAVAPAISVPSGDTAAINATLFVGPKLQDKLEKVADGLELTVDYGIFTPFSKILFWLLDHIHSLVGNWGWAIVLLTVLVKAVFFKLTEAQYKSMAKLKKLQPRIQSLKERYGDDKQQFNLKMMEIYKTEKVNPLGGCLPVLVQIPVFLALYWVLVESVELRQAPFMLWIQDLSSPDPYFILPLINGAAMFMTTKLSPNPAADPIQQKIMLAMPIVFSVMFAFFQAGLVLYWAVNATLSLAQQWVITKRIEAQDS